MEKFTYTARVNNPKNISSVGSESSIILMPDQIPKFTSQAKTQKLRTSEIASSQKKLPAHIGAVSIPNKAQKNISVAIIPEGYPDITLTKKQGDLTQMMLLKALDDITKGSHAPRFSNVTLRSGFLFVSCADLATKNWLQYVVTTNKPWSGAQLKVVDPKVFAKPIRVMVYIPGPIETPDKILKRLSLQNPGLKSETWRVVSKKSDHKGQQLMLLMDQKSWKAIETLDNRPYLNLQRVFFRNLTDKKKHTKKISSMNTHRHMASIQKVHSKQEQMIDSSICSNRYNNSNNETSLSFSSMALEYPSLCTNYQREHADIETCRNLNVCDRQSPEQSYFENYKIPTHKEIQYTVRDNIREQKNPWVSHRQTKNLKILEKDNDIFTRDSYYLSESPHEYVTEKGPYCSQHSTLNQIAHNNNYTSFELEPTLHQKHPARNFEAPHDYFRMETSRTSLNFSTNMQTVTANKNQSKKRNRSKSKKKKKKLRESLLTQTVDISRSTKICDHMNSMNHKNRINEKFHEDSLNSYIVRDGCSSEEESHINQIQSESFDDEDFEELIVLEETLPDSPSESDLQNCASDEIEHESRKCLQDGFMNEVSKTLEPKPENIKLIDTPVIISKNDETLDIG